MLVTEVRKITDRKYRIRLEDGVSFVLYASEVRKYRIRQQEDLAKEYGIPGFSTCPLMKEGQVFYSDSAKPDGFCDEAWKAIYQYVFALANGSEGWYDDTWIDPRHKV